MATRAFIVAVEEYAASTSLATRLQGANQDAESFRKWLIAKKGVAPANILCCAGQQVGWRTGGTDRNSIVAELMKLAQLGKDKTEEFYFFFSGHGFSYSDSPWEWQTDVLVGSDFVDTDQSGGACFKLQEIQQRLWNSLGPGDHYYFIDACRNPVKAEDIQVSVLGVKLPSSDLGKPTIYTLFSTSQGIAARVASGFTKLLVDGLHGNGRAKRWDGQRMYVTFEMLCDYVKQKMTRQEIDSIKKGPGKGYILELRPIPESECEVVVENAEPEDRFVLFVTNALGTAGRYVFSGPSCQLPLKPYDYFFNVTHPDFPVVQVAPPPSEPVDLYEPCKVHFRKEQRKKDEVVITGETNGRITGFGLPKKRIDLLPVQESTVDLEGAPGREILLERTETGTVYRGVGSLKEKVFPGAYRLKMREDGFTVEKRMVKLKPKEQARINLLDRPMSKMRESIFRTIPEAWADGMASFSETLGTTANRDLGSWLSVMGTSRIVAPPENFRKLGRLPLESFEKIPRDEGAIYVLAGMEKLQGEIKIALSKDAHVKWETLSQVEGLAGIYQRLLPTIEGPYLLSFKMLDRAPVTFATFCLPNRATLFVLTDNFNGGLKIHQYILPIHGSLKYMEPDVVGRLGRFNSEPLRVARIMAHVQKQFGRNRSVAESAKGNQEVEGAWLELIYAKWLDPIMSLLAAYELIRQHGTKSQAPLLSEMVGNLRRFFGGIPDIEVIAAMLDLGSKSSALKARMIDGPQDAPYAPPLFLDGLLMMEGVRSDLPLPYDKIDYNSPWTAWLGAVGEIPAK